MSGTVYLRNDHNIWPKPAMARDCNWDHLEECGTVKIRLDFWPESAMAPAIPAAEMWQRLSRNCLNEKTARVLLNDPKSNIEPISLSLLSFECEINSKFPFLLEDWNEVQSLGSRAHCILKHWKKRNPVTRTALRH
jgi:hypothetical protein